MNYELKINTASQAQAETRVVRILEAVLVIDFRFQRHVMTQEEGITAIDLRTEVAGTIDALHLEMGVFGRQAGIDADLVEIVTGTGTDIGGDSGTIRLIVI